MSITKSIGKNTLGGGNKMNVDLRTYNRSTHNLSHAFRTTIGVGTLVPFVAEVALPGDTWDIMLQNKVLTLPTVGPLYGSYKLQMDVFTCPIRLYNAKLHNNMLNIGLKMSEVKLPQLRVQVTKDEQLPTKDNKWSQVNPSSLLAYLGTRGYRGTKGQKFINAVPILAYYDIFKNYYANKQEDYYYTIGRGGSIEIVDNSLEFSERDNNITGGYFIIKGITQDDIKNASFVFKASRLYKGTTVVGNEIENYFSITTESTGNIKFTFAERTIQWGNLESVYYSGGATLNKNKLSELDDIRQELLSYTDAAYYINGGSLLNDQTMNVIEKLISINAEGKFYSSYPASGLAIKTHQSDIFNNWVQTEWLDGTNGINEITSIDTSSGKFTIDTLNLSQKVYDMLNRIAVSGGTYKDWLETVYSNTWTVNTETPVYEGGMSSEIIFDEVISTNTGSDEALGTLAGRGKESNKKGGRLKIKINEPSYIIGIVSITPRVDYCQGNRWDTALETLDDLHKPALDGIGFQDLMAWKMAWWANEDLAIGKQPAWIDYMTEYNRTYGGFAIENDSAFMVLNKFYYPENDDYQNGNINFTSYIQPQDFNYTFAETSPDAQNFWLQIGLGIECRRVMSAKQIPNL